MRRTKREQETDQIWARGEEKHKTWGTQLWQYKYMLINITQYLHVYLHCNKDTLK